MAQAILNIKLLLKNLAALNKLKTKIKAMTDRLKRGFSGSTRAVKGTNKEIQKTTGFLSQSAERLGFMAFQFVFLQGIASRALGQIRFLLQGVFDDGAKGLDAMVRAIAQSGIDIRGSTDDSRKAIDLLNDAILNLGGGDTIFGVEEVSSSFREIGKALELTGTEMEKANKLIKLSTQVLRLQTIEQVQADEAAKNIIKTMNNFSLNLSSATAVVDTLIRVNQNSAITLDELTRSFGFAAAAARDFGLDLEETGAFIGLLADRLGQSSGAAGRNFRILLVGLRKRAFEVDNVLQGFNETLFDSNNRLKPFGETLQVLRRVYGKAGDAQDKMSIALDKAIGLEVRGSDALKKLLAVTDDATQSAIAFARAGEIADLDKIFTGTPDARIKRLNNSLEVLKVQFVGGFAPALNVASDAMRQFIATKEVQEFIVGFGQALAQDLIPILRFAAQLFSVLAKFMAKNARIVTVLSKALIGMITLLGFLFIVGVIGTLVAALGSAFAKLAIFLGASELAARGLLFSLLRLIAVLAAAAFIFLGVRTLVGALIDGFQKGEEGILAFSLALIGLGLALSFALGGIPGLIAGAIAAGGLAAFLIGRNLADNGGFDEFASNIEGIKDSFNNLIAGISLENLESILTEGFEDAFETITGGLKLLADEFSGAGQIMGEKFRDAFIAILDFIKWITDSIQKGIDAFFEQGKLIGEQIRDGIVEGLADPIKVAIEGIFDQEIDPADSFEELFDRMQDRIDAAVDSIVESASNTANPFASLGTLVLPNLGELLNLTNFNALLLSGMQTALADSGETFSKSMQERLNENISNIRSGNEVTVKDQEELIALTKLINQGLDNIFKKQTRDVITIKELTASAQADMTKSLSDAFPQGLEGFIKDQAVKSIKQDEAGNVTVEFSDVNLEGASLEASFAEVLEKAGLDDILEILNLTALGQITQEHAGELLQAVAVLRSLNNEELARLGIDRTVVQELERQAAALATLTQAELTSFFSFQQTDTQLNALRRAMEDLAQEERTALTLSQDFNKVIPETSTSFTELGGALDALKDTAKKLNLDLVATFNIDLEETLGLTDDVNIGEAAQGAADSVDTIAKQAEEFANAIEKARAEAQATFEKNFGSGSNFANPDFSNTEHTGETVIGKGIDLAAQLEAAGFDPEAIAAAGGRVRDLLDANGTLIEGLNTSTQALKDNIDGGKDFAVLLQEKLKLTADSLSTDTDIQTQIENLNFEIGEVGTAVSGVIEPINQIAGSAQEVATIFNSIGTGSIDILNQLAVDLGIQGVVDSFADILDESQLFKDTFGATADTLNQFGGAMVSIIDEFSGGFGLTELRQNATDMVTASSPFKDNVILAGESLGLVTEQMEPINEGLSQLGKQLGLNLETLGLSIARFGTVQTAYGETEAAVTSGLTPIVNTLTATLTTDDETETTKIESLVRQIQILDKLSGLYEGRLLDEVLDTISEFGQTVSILNKVQIAMNDLIKAIRRLESKINRTRVKFQKNDEGRIIGFKLKGGVSKGDVLGGFGFAAEGGIATKPTFGTFGERGPEALIPLDKFGDLGGGDTNTVEINITIEGNASEETVQEITEAVAEELNKQLVNKSFRPQ